MKKPKHITHVKTFGFSPGVNVYVRDTCDDVCAKDGVVMNWSCLSIVSLEEAQEFYRNLGDALTYAWRQERRLARRASSVPKGNEVL